MKHAWSLMIASLASYFHRSHLVTENYVWESLADSQISSFRSWSLSIPCFCLPFPHGKTFTSTGMDSKTALERRPREHALVRTLTSIYRRDESLPGIYETCCALLMPPSKEGTTMVRLLKLRELKARLCPASQAQTKPSQVQRALERTMSSECGSVSELERKRCCSIRGPARRTG